MRDAQHYTLGVRQNHQRIIQDILPAAQPRNMLSSLRWAYRASRDASKIGARTSSGDCRINVKWTAFLFDGWTCRRATSRRPD